MRSEERAPSAGILKPRISVVKWVTFAKSARVLLKTIRTVGNMPGANNPENQ